MVVIVTGLAVAFWEKILEQNGPRFDQKAIADRRSQQRLNGRLIGCVAAIGTGKEADAAGEQRRILCVPIPDRA